MSKVPARFCAYWITVNYREAYGMHASNGVLFNHKGPTRDETFVTRKITRAVAMIDASGQVPVELDSRYYRPAEIENLFGDP